MAKKSGMKTRLVFLFGAVALFLTGVGFAPTKFASLTLGGQVSWKDRVEEIFASESYLKNSTYQQQADIFVGAGSANDLIHDSDPSIDIFNAFLGEQAPFVTEGSRADTLGIKSYEVSPGDTPASLAKRFDISIETILAANNLRYGDYIRPGEVLLILPASGILHKVQSGQTLASIAQNYDVDTEIIAKTNLVAADGSDLEVNQELFIPGGKQSIGQAPPKQGTSLANYDDYYSFPTTGRNWGRVHSNNGVDIANVCGTVIYAAASGNVVDTSFTQSTYRYVNGGYGNFIKISHPNGTQTMYAHLLSLLVNDGDSVTKGQPIAWMGGRPGTPGAGNSTGCHLHFEIRGAKNPFIRY